MHRLINAISTEQFFRQAIFLNFALTILNRLVLVLYGALTDLWVLTIVIGFLWLMAWLSTPLVAVNAVIGFFRTPRFRLGIYLLFVFSIGINSILGLHFFATGAILGAHIAGTDQIIEEARALMKTCGRDLDLNEAERDYLMRCYQFSESSSAIARLHPIQVQIYSNVVLIRKIGFGDWGGFSVRAEGLDNDCQFLVVDGLCWSSYFTP